MSDSDRQRWLGRALLVGVGYLAIGLGSAALAGAAATPRAVFLWRLSAFIVRGVVLAADVGYETLRLGNPARRTAGHAALAVAIGGLGLALAANLHDLGAPAGYRPKMLIALVAWPVLVAVPAFLVALVIAAGLGMQRSRGRPTGD